MLRLKIMRGLKIVLCTYLVGIRCQIAFVQIFFKSNMNGVFLELLSKARNISRGAGAQACDCCDRIWVRYHTIPPIYILDRQLLRTVVLNLYLESFLFSRKKLMKDLDFIRNKLGILIDPVYKVQYELFVVFSRLRQLHNFIDKLRPSWCSSTSV